MPKPRPKHPKRPHPSGSIRVRLDAESKAFLAKAAELRRISASREQTITLTPEEQLAFWYALNEPPRLTEAQRRLGEVMRKQS
jgi:uncharacterized protein (DUF1778 family)